MTNWSDANKINKNQFQILYIRLLRLLQTAVLICLQSRLKCAPKVTAAARCQPGTLTEWYTLPAVSIFNMHYYFNKLSILLHRFDLWCLGASHVLVRGIECICYCCVHFDRSSASAADRRMQIVLFEHRHRSTRNNNNNNKMWESERSAGHRQLVAAHFAIFQSNGNAK